MNNLLTITGIMLLVACDYGCKKKDPCLVGITFALGVGSNPFDNANCIDPIRMNVGILSEGTVENSCTKAKTNVGSPSTTFHNLPLPSLVTPRPALVTVAPSSSTVVWEITLLAQCCSITVDATNCNNSGRGAMNILKAKGTSHIFKPVIGTQVEEVIPSSSWKLIAKNCCP